MVKGREVEEAWAVKSRAAKRCMVKRREAKRHGEEACPVVGTVAVTWHGGEGTSLGSHQQRNNGAVVRAVRVAARETLSHGGPNWTLSCVGLCCASVPMRSVIFD
eukprot:2386477-Rhodomonas_salina.1